MFSFRSRNITLGT